LWPRFRDGLGVRHEDGHSASSELAAPDGAKLVSAAATLAASYPAADISLYFSTLLLQDPDTWGALADLPQVQPAASPRS
jgi:hypothetical protein